MGTKKAKCCYFCTVWLFFQKLSFQTNERDIFLCQNFCMCACVCARFFLNLQILSFFSTAHAQNVCVCVRVCLCVCKLKLKKSLNPIFNIFLGKYTSNERTSVFFSSWKSGFCVGCAASLGMAVPPGFCGEERRLKQGRTRFNVLQSHHHEQCAHNIMCK